MSKPLSKGQNVLAEVVGGVAASLLSALIVMLAWNALATPRGLPTIDYMGGLLVVIIGHNLIPFHVSTAAGKINAG